MHQAKQVPPQKLTPDQRRHEIASLLTNGLVRLRNSAVAPSAKVDRESEFELGFSGDQRVHTDPVNYPTTESR